MHFLAPIRALVFCRFGDLSKEAMIQAIKDKDLRFLQVKEDHRFQQVLEDFRFLQVLLIYRKKSSEAGIFRGL